MARKIKNLKEYTEKTNLGAELYNNRKFEEALIIFLELSEYNTDNYKIYETLALIYIKLNNLEEAEKAYTKARKVFSRKHKTNFELQTFDEIVSRLETLDKLKAMYESENDEIKSGNKSHQLPIKVGMQYMARGDYKQAEEFLLAHRKKYSQNN